MNDYAAFYREIAALEREASRGQRRQRRSGAAWERTPEANAQPEERQEPEWSAALRSARVSQGMPAEATDQPLDPVALARLRGDVLENRYSPLNEDWGWLDLPAGLAVATGETFVDSLASPFSEGARQRNEVRRQMLRRAGGGLADALDSWTLDNPGSRDWGTRSNFWEDRQGATNLNELVSGSPGQNRRADVQQTLADMDARSRGVWVEPDMTVTADSRPSALRRLGAMGSDIWRGPSEAAREGRRTYPVYMALAEQARGAGDNAAAEDYERAARGAALADAANTGSGALEAAPGIGAIDAVLGVGRLSGREFLRATAGLADNEMPWYLNPVDWSPTAAYTGRFNEGSRAAVHDPGLLTRQAEPIRNAVMAAPVGAIATDQLMDGDAGDANQLAGGALLTAGAITGAPMALRGAGDFVRRRLGGADPLADIAPRAEAGAARELDNGTRVYEDGYARTTIEPDGRIVHTYQGGFTSGATDARAAGSGGEAVSSMRAAQRALERDINETQRPAYHWYPGDEGGAPDPALQDFYRRRFEANPPPGYAFSEDADGTMHLNRVVDAEAAPAPERNFEAAMRERAGRRPVRIGEQVNRDGTVAPRSEINWDDPNTRLPADYQEADSLAGMPTGPADRRLGAALAAGGIGGGAVGLALEGEAQASDGSGSGGGWELPVTLGGTGATLAALLALARRRGGASRRLTTSASEPLQAQTFDDAVSAIRSLDGREIDELADTFGVSRDAPDRVQQIARLIADDEEGRAIMQSARGEDVGQGWTLHGSFDGGVELHAAPAPNQIGEGSRLWFQSRDDAMRYLRGEIDEGGDAIALPAGTQESVRARVPDGQAEYEAALRQYFDEMEPDELETVAARFGVDPDAVNVRELTEAAYLRAHPTREHLDFHGAAISETADRMGRLGQSTRAQVAEQLGVEGANPFNIADAFLRPLSPEQQRRLNSAGALAGAGAGGWLVGSALEGEAQADDGSDSDGLPMLPILGAGAATLPFLLRRGRSGRLADEFSNSVGMSGGRPQRRLGGGSGFDSSVNPERGPVSGGQTGTEAVPDLPPVEQTRTNVPRGAPAGARDYLNRRNARILELIEEMQPVRNARSGAANPNARMGERLDNGYRAIAERLREEGYGEVTHNVIKGVVNRNRGRAQTATAEAASAGADEAAAQRLGMSVERYRALSARKRNEAIAAIGVTSAGGLLLANDAEAEGFDPNGRWVGEERQRDMGDGRVELRQRFIDSEGRAYDGVRYRTQDPQTGEVRVSAPQFTPLDEIAAPQLGDTYDTTEVPLRPEEIERIQAMRDEESRRHGLTPDQERSDVAASGDETTPPWALGLPLVTGVIGGRVGRRLGAARGQPLVGETTGALTVGGVTGAGAGAFTEADDIGELVTFGAALGGGGRAAYRGGQEGLRRGAEALADVRMPAPRRVRGQPLPYVGDDLSAAAPPGSLRPPPARQPDRVSGSLDEGDLAREMSGRAIEVGRRRVRPTPVAMEERMNIPAGARGSLEGRLQTLGAEPLRELARREGLSTDGTVRALASRLAEAARADPARIQRYRDIFQALGVSGVILGGAMQLLPENAEANAMEDWAEGVDWQNVGVGAAAAGLAVMGRTVAPQVLDDIVPRNARLGQLSRVGEVPADIPPSLFDIERSRLGRAAFRERSPADAGAASPAPAEQFGAGVAAGALGGWGAAELIDPYVETPQEEEARWMREVMPYFELRQHALELRMQGVQSWEVSDPELAAELRALEEAEGVEGPRRLRPIQ